MKYKKIGKWKLKSDDNNKIAEHEFAYLGGSLHKFARLERQFGEIMGELSDEGGIKFKNLVYHYMGIGMFFLENDLVEINLKLPKKEEKNPMFG